MTDYTYTKNFGAKDKLATGNSNKIIKGADFDVEFNALETAVNSKVDSISPAVTGSATAVNLNVTGDFSTDTNASLNGVTVGRGASGLSSTTAVGAFALAANTVS